MPIITLGTIDPEAIIVETGTLPEDFYATLQTNDVDMHEPVDLDTKASLIVNYMNNTNLEKPADNTINKVESKKKSQCSDEETITEALKVRSDLLEFSPRKDGSVNCKLCGKIFASSQHWHKHKYRVHVVHPKVDPVPLNKCEKCLVFFKSRKGFLGHMSSKHSESQQDVRPVLSNEQTTVSQIIQELAKPITSGQPKSKVPDPEMDIPKTILQNYQATTSRNTSKARNGDKKKTQSAAKAAEEIDPIENQARRVNEESFVMGIIEKVRRQCATQPEMANRRGYYKKPYPLRI